MKNFNLKSLSRDEMRNISGGGEGKAGCCYLTKGKSPICGLKITEAKAMYALSQENGATNTGWCCASC